MISLFTQSQWIDIRGLRNNRLEGVNAICIPFFLSMGSSVPRCQNRAGKHTPNFLGGFFNGTRNDAVIQAPPALFNPTAEPFYYTSRSLSRLLLQHPLLKIP